jgi:hypothetical protein
VIERAVWRSILKEVEHLLYRAEDLEALQINPDAVLTKDIARPSSA